MKHTALGLGCLVALSLFGGTVGPGRARAAAGASTVERTRLVVERNGDRSIVTTRGLPALRRDGRVVAAYEQSGDFVAGNIALIDVRTGRQLSRIPMPEHVRQTDDGDVERRVDHAGVRRVNRILARYAPLTQLVRVDDPPPTTGAPTVDSFDRSAMAHFTSTSLRAEARTFYPAEDDPRTTVTIERTTGRTSSRVLTTTTAAEHIESIAVAPGGSFFVVQNGMCGCECAYWSTLAR